MDRALHLITHKVIGTSQNNRGCCPCLGTEKKIVFILLKKKGQWATPLIQVVAFSDMNYLIPIMAPGVNLNYSTWGSLHTNLINCTSMVLKGTNLSILWKTLNPFVAVHEVACIIIVVPRRTLLWWRFLSIPMQKLNPCYSPALDWRLMVWI